MFATARMSAGPTQAMKPFPSPRRQKMTAGRAATISRVRESAEVVSRLERSGPEKPDAT